MPMPPIAPGVAIEEGSAGALAIAGAPTSIAAFVDVFARGPVGVPVRVTGFGEVERAFGGADPAGPGADALRLFFANGGREAWVVRVVPDGAPRLGDALTGDPAARTGMHALDAVDHVNILCLPRLAGLADPAEVRAGYARAVAYARGRRAMLILDPPAGVAGLAELSAWLGADAALRDANAALYLPRLAVADAAAPGGRRLAGTSGAMAGLWARRDAERGVWATPAGTDAPILGTLGPERDIGAAENAALAAIGVNAIRRFAGRGILAWGGRTLSAPDGVPEDGFLAVRRLRLFIAESVARGMRPAVFEPNAEPLWARVRLGIGAFLDGLFRQGAFSGPSPRDAYYLRCGRDTMTAAEVAAGLIRVEIGIAPIRPAEFVILRIEAAAAPPEA